MKRIFSIVALLLTLALIFGASVSALAAEAELNANEGETELPTTPEPTPDGTNTDVSEESAPGLLDRFKEYIEEGKLTELLSLAVSLVVAALICYLKKKFGEVGSAVISSNKSVSAKIADDDKTRREVSAHFLELIDTLKEMIFKRIDELDKALDEVKERLDNGVTAEQARRLETITFDAIKMLDTVYMGSSTIPSTVKERVAESYNHAERTMRNDEIIGEEP